MCVGVLGDGAIGVFDVNFLAVGNEWASGKVEEDFGVGAIDAVFQVWWSAVGVEGDVVSLLASLIPLAKAVFILFESGAKFTAFRCGRLGDFPIGAGKRVERLTGEDDFTVAVGEF